MGLFTRLVVALSLSILPVAGAACAPDSAPDEPGEEFSREEAALAVPFEVLPFTRGAAQPGLTLIKNKTQFKEFFGVAAPSDLSFVTHWVLHFSTGVQNSGGYKAEITGVERTGSGATKALEVSTRWTSPGPGCIVTLALTNPQMTVKIKRQAAQIPVQELSDQVVTDCSEPDWCTAALCGPGTTCDELVDACVEEAFCPKVKCANGYTCDEDANACVNRPCDPDDASTCPSGFACENHIMCITTPCPGDFRCYEADPCQGITYEGLCDENTLKYCEDSELHIIPCGSQECGFDSQYDYYDCL